MPRLSPCTPTALILPAGLVTHCRKAAGVQEEEKGRQKILDVGTSLCDSKIPIGSGLLLGKAVTKEERVKACTILSDMRLFVKQEGERQRSVWGEKGLFIYFLFYLEVQHSAQGVSRGGKPRW